MYNNTGGNCKKLHISAQDMTERSSNDKEKKSIESTHRLTLVNLIDLFQFTRFRMPDYIKS